MGWDQRRDFGTEVYYRWERSVAPHVGGTRPMKKPIALIAAVYWIAVGADPAQAETKTLTGTISDSMCGASHAAMRSHGEKVTDRECTIACVSYQTPDAPKYVFVSSGKIYPIANQKFPGLGRRSE